MNQNENKLNREDVKTYHKAKLLASWSYAGILLPLIGWILGSISRSMINSLPEPKTLTIQRRYKHVKNVALGGVIASTLVMLVGGTLITIGRVELQREQQQTELKAQQDAEQAAQQAALDESATKLANEQSLKDCLSGVDERIKNAASASRVSYQEAQILLQFRQQYIDECNAQYPQ